MTCKQRSKIVFTDQIAIVLPVGKWFIADEFADCTGVKKGQSSIGRLRLLYKNKPALLLTRKVGKNRQYMMTEHHKALMLKQHNKNRVTRSNSASEKKRVSDDLVKNIKKAELLAHKENAVLFLKAVKFI